MEATQINARPVKVKIECDGVEIIEVPQRDLFGKYGWPAENTITEALTKYKEDNKL